MKKLFVFVAFFLSFCYAATAQQNKLFLDAAILKLQRSKNYTIAVAHLMPKEKYIFKPVEGEMGFGEQLLHLASNMGWLCSTYLSKQPNPISAADKKIQDKDSIIAIVDKTYTVAISILKTFESAHLSDTVSFFAGPMNKLQIINLLNDHQTHHRAQMLVYLRLNGIKPPDYIGW